MTDREENVSVLSPADSKQRLGLFMINLCFSASRSWGLIHSVYFARLGKGQLQPTAKYTAEAHLKELFYLARDL